MTIDIFIIKLSVVILLAWCLYLGQKVCITVMSNIDKLGRNEKGKEKIATRTIANFWIGFAAVIIIVSGVFELIGTELFIALLIADLGGLGLKLSTELIQANQANNG